MDRKKEIGICKYEGNIFFPFTISSDTKVERSDILREAYIPKRNISHEESFMKGKESIFMFLKILLLLA